MTKLLNGKAIDVLLKTLLGFKILSSQHATTSTWFSSEERKYTSKFIDKAENLLLY